MVQILNCLQFNSQIKNASVKMELGFSSACHTRVSFCGLRIGDEFMKCWVLWGSVSWRLHAVGIESDKAQMNSFMGYSSDSCLCFPAKNQDKLTLPKLSAGTAWLLPIGEQARFNHGVCSPALITDLQDFLNANWSWAEWHSHRLGFTLWSWLEMLCDFWVDKSMQFGTDYLSEYWVQLLPLIYQLSLCFGH